MVFRICCLLSSGTRGLSLRDFLTAPMIFVIIRTTAIGLAKVPYEKWVKFFIPLLCMEWVPYVPVGVLLDM